MNGAPLTGPGNLIKGRWKILKKIGQGAFGRKQNSFFFLIFAYFVFYIV